MDRGVKLIILIPVLLLNLMLFTSFGLLAQENINYQIKTQKINPNNTTIYKIERLAEKIQENIYKKLQSDKLSNFYLTLSDKRLAELYFLSKNNMASYIETSSARYQTTIGLMLEKLPSGEYDKNFYSSTIKNQEGVLKYLLNNETTDSSEWLLIKQSLETAQSAASTIDK